MMDPYIEQALGSREPVSALRSLVLRLMAEGQTRDVVLELFERARQQLRQANREVDEDAVTDVMDCLVGWCSPHMKVPPEQPASGGRN